MGIDFTSLLNRNRQLFLDKWSRPSEKEVTKSCPTHPMPRFELFACDEPGLRIRPVRPKLSLCMIVRDSARTLGACLESIRPWVDEMVVVDTGSLDSTPQIADSYGAKVFHFPWCDDFSAARNQSLAHATGDWLFWMDSDDTIDAENGRKLRELVDGLHAPEVTAYVAQVHCPHEKDGRDFTAVDHVKLFRNLPELRFEGRIHEQILPAINRLEGTVGWTDIFVVHSGSDHTVEGQAKKLARDLKLLLLEDAERSEHPFTLFNLGMTYLELKRYEEAAQHLERSIAVAGPQESHVPKAFSLLIQALSEMRQLDEARKRCEDGLDRYPDDPELTFRAGVLAHHFGRSDDAERYYRKVLSASFEPKFRSIDHGILGYKTHQNLAALYDAQGRQADAENEWRLILKERPDYLLAWKGLVAVLLKQQKLTEARAMVAGADILRKSPAVLTQLEASIEEAAGNAANARRILEMAVRNYPDDLEVRDAFCRYLFEHGDADDAELAIQALVEKYPDNAAGLYNLATIRLRRGEYEAAAEAYRASLALRPDWPPAHENLATCYRQLGRSHEVNGVFAEPIQSMLVRVSSTVEANDVSETQWFRSAEELAEAVEECIGAAERGESKLTPEVLAVHGMTSIPIRHLLNRLGALPDCRFLEIGTWYGATALAASYDNSGTFISVDNFSQFRKPDPRPILLANFNKFKDRCRIDFREIDCWQLASEIEPSSINVYLYDGTHTRDAQTNALLRFADAFADPFVLLIDDWNYEYVKQGTRDALEQLGWSVHREWSRRTDYNGDADSWWNGLFVAVVKKQSHTATPHSPSNLVYAAS
jgi:tetratricopeptide (TPR) repeat protein